MSWLVLGGWGIVFGRIDGWGSVGDLGRKGGGSEHCETIINVYLHSELARNQSECIELIK
jgi:hypothetical protein